MKIQKPSRGRVVLFTTPKSSSDDPTNTEMYEFTGLITDPHGHGDGMVDIVYFHDEGNKTIFEIAVPHSLVPKANTWRYPPRVEGEIEVSE